MSANSIESYWQSFLATLPADSSYRQKTYVSDGWGDGPEMAQELGQLIAAGVKTATCSSLWEWQIEGEPLPEPGYLTIVLDGKGQPLCIVETTEVTVRAFNEVDMLFAYDEGEGDRSLADWQDVHRRFFSGYLTRYGRKFSEDMPLVCERFKVIYR